MRRTALLVGTTVAAALLAACGTEGAAPTTAAEPTGSAGSTGPTGPAEGTASSRPSATAPTDTASSAGGADTDSPAGGLSEFTGVEPQLEPASAAGLVLTDVRASEHDGFGRVVLEFSGTGTPGWAVNYVDEAVLDGSGEVVTIAGDTVLDVYASGTTWPAPGYYDGPDRVQPQGDGGLAELFVGGTFEGTTQVLVGLDGEQAPFRVFALTEPSRLVVDVED